MFEIDPKKFGASYDIFLDAIHPDDRENVNFAYTNSLKNRTPYVIDHRLSFADGRIKYVHEQCETFYDENGKPIRSMGTVQDITERKLTEEALRTSEAIHKAFFENSMDAVILGYPDGTIFAANPAACDLFRTTEEQMCILGRKALIDQTDPRFWALIKERGETGKSQTEVTMIKVDGTKFEADLRTSMYADSTGKKMV